MSIDFDYGINKVSLEYQTRIGLFMGSWSFLRKVLSIPGRGILIRNRLGIVVKVTYLRVAQAFIFDPLRRP